MSQAIYMGVVTSICDEYSGNRIRVKLPTDGSVEPKEGYPYAFPLLPKTFQVTPKKGEMVIVFLTDPDSRDCPRFYIGPIISQPQKMYEDKVSILDRPTTLINSVASEMETIEHFRETFGSFPKLNDVALVGRKSEDVILKDDEVNIRCGVRNYADGSDNKSIVGDIIYNTSNPAYIQLKHRRGEGTMSNNLINFVGGGINLMSNQDAYDITTYMQNNNNVDTCVDEKINKLPLDDTEKADELTEVKSNASFAEPDYDKIMKKLHQLPYGDILVEILEIIRTAILTHTHRWAQEPPTTENVPSIINLQTWGQGSDLDNAPDLGDILLSNTVRIS